MKSTWNYDNTHAKIGFSVSHMTLSDVDGSFKDVEATITASNDDLSDAEATFTAKVSSVNTDNEKEMSTYKTKIFLMQLPIQLLLLRVLHLPKQKSKMHMSSMVI